MDPNRVIATRKPLDEAGKPGAELCIFVTFVRKKVAGTLRRAVRSLAFTRIPGGRHMECAYDFDFCRLCPVCDPIYTPPGPD